MEIKSWLFFGAFLSVAISSKADEKNQNENEKKVYEPAFPTLFQDGESEAIHIVSESYDNGYETTEEFLDPRTYRSVFVSRNKTGKSVIFIDVYQNIMYQYEAYTCKTQTVQDLNYYESGHWFSPVSYKLPTGGSALGTLFGIAAIWLNAEKKEKYYTTTYSRIYSPRKDIKQMAHKWIVADKKMTTWANLYFVENKVFKTNAEGSIEEDIELSLEMIELTSMKTQKTRTYNILAVDHVIPDNVRSDLLQVPLGYGCHQWGEMELERRRRGLNYALDEWISGRYLRELLDTTYKIQLEATVTNYESVEGNKRSSDSISVELVGTNRAGPGKLRMLRHRDSNKDVKIVMNHILNTQYTIDLKGGLCEISNILEKSERDEGIALNFRDSRFDIKMDMTTMNEIFTNASDFYYIKRNDMFSLSTFYFEKTSKTLFPGRTARIMRAYTGPVIEGRARIDNMLLDSVTIWLLDERLEKVLTSYHLKLVEAESVETDAKLAQLFDVSDECYLNNNRMRANRDFAWVELSYSVPNVFMERISANVDKIKEIAYNLLRSRDISILNAPRVELMLDDDSMTIRMLLLDMPPLPVLYNYRADSMLIVDKSAGDLEELTQDLQHCADLCRLNKCAVMSFSETTFTCLLGRARAQEDERKLFVKSAGFKSFVAPTKDGKSYLDFFKLSLHSILADLQHKEYDDLMILKMPEEMSRPASETGISADERYQISMDYMNKLAKFIKESGHKIPILTFILNFDSSSLVFVPNKFQLESDPLEEFDLVDRQPWTGSEDEGELNDPSRLSASSNFHEGLSLHRYKISGLLSAPATKFRSKSFEGLSYDQCALACLGAKCSSFSYCGERKECIVTDIWDIGSKMSSANMIEQDLECFIVQRDFLGKFNRFAGVSRPYVYKKQIKSVLNPSECAHSCVVEKSFNCLAFDYCPASGNSPDGSAQGSCFFREERFLYTGKNGTGSGPKNSRTKKLGEKGCDHYSRSYLGDFVRIEYRKIADDVMEKLDKQLLEGYSVDQCADKCVNEFPKCTAFQFCFNPNQSAKRSPLQSCTMIDSKPEGLKAEDIQVVLNETASGEPVKVGKIFIPEEDCHIFSLRKDAGEAQLRELALDASSAEEHAAEEERRRKSGKGQGMSLGSALILFFLVTFQAAALTFGLLIARERSELVRHHWDRMHARLVR